MEERLFLDKSAKPTQKTMQSALGDTYAYFEELMNITKSFLKDWNFSKSSGWMLKVHDKKKALFYLIPFKNEFKISMAVRENERKIFLEDYELEEIHDAIKSAKQYREGFVLRFKVTDDVGYEILELLIGKLISLR